MDLVKKRTISLYPETYARLTRLAAELKLQRLDGGMVSLDMAVGVLLDGWAVLKDGYQIPNIESSRNFNDFGKKYFGDLEPKNETE
jgi:hypothetical protein